MCPGYNNNDMEYHLKYLDIVILEQYHEVRNHLPNCNHIRPSAPFINTLSQRENGRDFPDDILNGFS